MTIKNVTINTVITIVLLISHSYAWNMKRNSLITKEYLKAFYSADTNEDRLQRYITNINSGILGTFPSETLKAVFLTISHLDVKIKTILALRTTCKKFSALTFQDIAEICQHHTNDEKKTLLHTIETNNVDYWKKRTSFLILSLIAKKEGFVNRFQKQRDITNQIILKNDIDAVKIMKLNFNLQRVYELLPNVQTPDMALELCKINNVDLKNIINTDTMYNMVRRKNKKSLEMIEFYIQKNVTINTINAESGNSLLHDFIQNICYLNNPEDKTIKAIELLVDACPGLVYITNHQGKTPKDTALEMRDRDQHHYNLWNQQNKKDPQIGYEFKANVVIYTDVLEVLNKKADL